MSEFSVLTYFLQVVYFLAFARMQHDSFPGPNLRIGRRADVRTQCSHTSLTKRSVTRASRVASIGKLMMLTLNMDTSAIDESTFSPSFKHYAISWLWRTRRASLRESSGHIISRRQQHQKLHQGKHRLHRIISRNHSSLHLL